MSQPDFQVSLRLSGDNLIPTDVSRCLGCAATEAHHMGEEFQSGRFTKRAPTGVPERKGERKGDAAH